MRALTPAASKAGTGAFAPLLSSTRGRVLQRKCDCGQHTGGGECEECKKKKDKSSGDPLLQRSALNRGAVNGVPPIVHEVLRSPGRPLDPATRAYFEPRFGQDFSHVRVHTNERASESAAAVNASAYAYGNNVVFGKNQFSTNTEAGRNILAHELVHVVQAGNAMPLYGPQEVSSVNDTSEVEAENAAKQALSGEWTRDEQSRGGLPQIKRRADKLSRLVGPSTTHCAPGKNGIPADPLGTLTNVEAHAKGLAEATGILFAAAAAGVSMGITTGSVMQAYEDHFGKPPKKGAGFLNRLTGAVKKTQEEAMQGELEGIASRYDSMDQNFGKVLKYRCINGAVSLDGCDTDCVNADASACQGIRTFFLCPSFWSLSQTSMSTLLIHESFHMLSGQPGHGGKGVGKNLRHAECYATTVGDIFNLGTAGGPACPSPPQ
jgi:uncharacterized protein DUF4157